MDKIPSIMFPIGGPLFDENGNQIEPTVIPIGPKHDGDNPSIPDVSGFGNGPTFVKP